MTKEEFMEEVGDFCWNYANKFFIETRFGNFIWSDPDYLGGDNTIEQFGGSYEDFVKLEKIPYCRDKGKHRIRDYCGEEFTFIIQKL